MSASDGSTASEWVPTGSVTVRVPGKVNLYLAVGECRDDGYHELTTIFHAVSLLDEVTALVEWPVSYECNFEPSFLAVPQECLILTMQTNQKYFALADNDPTGGAAAAACVKRWKDAGREARVISLKGFTDG